MPILLQRGTPPPPHIYLQLVLSSRRWNFDFPLCVCWLIVCRPTFVSYWIRNININSFISASNFIFLSSFYTFLLLFSSFCGSEGRGFSSVEVANLIRVSLSLSFFSSSHFPLYHSPSSVPRTNLGGRRIVNTTQLIRKKVYILICINYMFRPTVAIIRFITDLRGSHISGWGYW